MVIRRKNKVARPPGGWPLSDSFRVLAGVWTADILWYLREQPRRFTELKYDLGSISAKMLSARLRRLEGDGAVCRREVETSPPTVEYALTETGRGLVRIVEAAAEMRAARADFRSLSPSPNTMTTRCPPARNLRHLPPRISNTRMHNT